MQLWLAIVIIVVIFGITTFLGIRLNRGKPHSDRWLPHGFYRIEALVWMDDNYVCFVLWNYHERNNRYVKIKRSHILEFNRWKNAQRIKDSAEKILVYKKERGGLRYI